MYQEVEILFSLDGKCAYNSQIMCIKKIVLYDIPILRVLG